MSRTSSVKCPNLDLIARPQYPRKNGFGKGSMFYPSIASNPMPPCRLEGTLRYNNATRSFTFQYERDELTFAEPAAAKLPVELLDEAKVSDVAVVLKGVRAQWGKNATISDLKSAEKVLG